MFQIQNSKNNKDGFGFCPRFNRGWGLFSPRLDRGSDLGFRIFDKKGVTLLLMVVILSALFSISIGIFNVVFGELRISGEIADSFVAFYAADQGIERVLYRDRIQDAICPVGGIDCYTEGVPTPVMVDSGGCYKLRVSKTGGNTDIISAGQYRCGVNPPRVVKRGFMVTY